MASSFAHGHLAHGIPRTDGNRWEQMDGYISSTRTQYPHSYHSHRLPSPVESSKRTETPAFNESIPALPRVLDLVCKVKEIAIKAMERSDSTLCESARQQSFEESWVQECVGNLCLNTNKLWRQRTKTGPLQ